MIPDQDTPEAEPTSARDLGAGQRAKIYPPNVKGWAVIVGISRYSHAPWNLGFADRDAEKLAELVSAPAGGRFEAVHLLVNEKATYANLNKALRSFLKQPDRDDIVLLYFACHGAPDPDRPENIYLLAYDSDPADISGTGLPMAEIDRAIKHTLRAERVVILADTCHSGGIGGGSGLRGIDQSAVVNKYLKDLSQARGGVALLTSAAANETSREGKQWGEGHGVFTHFLLEGMRGKADGYGGQARDGKVGVRELFEYVRDMVKKETRDGQHPVIGPDAFDPGLPMAITGEVNANEHCELAARLEHLARRLDEPARYRAAAAHFAEAFQFARSAETVFAEAELGLGRSLAGAGDLDEAVRVLTRLIEREKENAPAHAHLWLGVARAMQHAGKDAAAALDTFAQRAPQDECAVWARRYAAWLKSGSRGERYAILIGIDRYRAEAVSPLQGCVNDVRLMREILTTRFDIPEANIVALENEAATRNNILSTFASMSAKTARADRVLVFYSGHSVPESRPDAHGLPVRGGLYLIVHDTSAAGGYLDNGISAQELHASMKALPVSQKVLMLDTHPSDAFNTLADTDGDYAVLLASDTAQVTGEAQVMIEGKAQTVGAFTAAIGSQLSAADAESVTCGALLDGAVTYMRQQKRAQTPVLIGDRALPFLGEEDALLNGFQFAQRRSYAGLSATALAWRYRRFSAQLDFPFAPLHRSLGLALAEKGLFELAGTALKTASAQTPGVDQETTVALTRVQLATGSYGALRETLKQLRNHVPASQATRAAAARECAERLVARRRYALLVGISRYAGRTVPEASGAVNDALAMKQMLGELDFRPDDVTVLLDGAATRAAILTEFRALAEKARDEPALFFFAGNGSLQPGVVPTLLSADSRLEGVYDLPLGELAGLSAQSANLVAVLDCGWKLGGPRSAPFDQRLAPASRGVISWTWERMFQELPQRISIGGLTIGSKRALLSTQEAGADQAELTVPHRLVAPGVGSEDGAVQGRLTYSLIRGMRRVAMERPTYAQWLEASRADMESEDPFIVNGNRLNDPMFESVTLRTEAFRQITLIDQAPLDDLIHSLQRLIDQRQQQGDTYPHGRLDLGVAYAATGDLAKASDALDRAVALYSDPSIMGQERARDPRADEWFHEARYQLGRVLYESKRDLARAVNELEKVVDKDPDNGRALYYYGQAIRAMVERETLSKAQEVLERYLGKGAPLGHDNEVREFLGSRAKAHANA